MRSRIIFSCLVVLVGLSLASVLLLHAPPQSHAQVATADIVTPVAQDDCGDVAGNDDCNGKKPTKTPAPTPTRTPTRTPRVTNTFTPVPTLTPTQTGTPTVQETATAIATVTASPTVSPVPTVATTPGFLVRVAWLPAIANVPPLTNHTACSALVLAPPASISQRANNPFNIYEFTAVESAYSIAVEDYATTGRLLTYEVAADACATSGTMTLIFRSDKEIVSSAQIALSVSPGKRYLVAVNTTGALTDLLYTISIQP